MTARTIYELATLALVLNRQRLSANAERMGDKVRLLNVTLRPHVTSVIGHNLRHGLVLVDSGGLGQRRNRNRKIFTTLEDAARQSILMGLAGAIHAPPSAF